MQLGCKGDPNVRPFALLRGPRHAQLLAFRRNPPFSSRSQFAAPTLFSSSLSDSASNKYYRENWVKVIEEYEKDKKQLAQDLGVPESSGRVRIRIRIRMNGNKQLAQERAVDGSGGLASKNYLTKVDPFRQFVWEVASFVGLMGMSYIYYAITGKERPKPKDRKMLTDKNEAEEEGAEVWFSKPDFEGEWQGQD